MLHSYILKEVRIITNWKLSFHSGHDVAQIVPSPSLTPLQPCLQYCEPHPQICEGLAEADLQELFLLTWKISPGAEGNVEAS